MNHKKKTNAFEAVCNMAADCSRAIPRFNDGPCWRIFCTTCGHAGFRYAFYQLALGLHPNDEQWVNTFDSSDDFYTLGSPAEIARVFKGSSVLYETFAQASVRTILQNGIGSASLGHIGLALFHTESQEQSQRKLTTEWCPELLEMVPRDSSASVMLQERIDSKSSVLSWRDLGVIDKCMNWSQLYK
jgi:hypothetical protein